MLSQVPRESRTEVGPGPGVTRLLLWLWGSGSGMLCVEPETAMASRGVLEVVESRQRGNWCQSCLFVLGELELGFPPKALEDFQHRRRNWGRLNIIFNLF